ncbi:MAG: Rid family detoxifying hydrolase [Oscillospiraceae bacterium]
MEIIKTDKAPAAIGPYSQAAVAGGLVFVSGQLPLDPATGALAEDAAQAADRSLLNIAAILEARGLTMADVVKVNIFLQNMEDFAAVNEVYAKHFSEPYPARACVAVKALPKNAVLEIEAVAAVR